MFLMPGFVLGSRLKRLAQSYTKPPPVDNRSWVLRNNGAFRLRARHTHGGLAASGGGTLECARISLLPLGK